MVRKSPAVQPNDPKERILKDEYGQYLLMRRVSVQPNDPKERILKEFLR
jgi:hypothetical protein